MEPNPNAYRISFFNPTTQIARHNRNIVIWLVCIWTVAIFGFQIMLRVIQKPMPEPAYLSYEKVWDRIFAGSAGSEELKEFASASVSVLAKNYISPAERAALSNGLSHSVFKLIPDDQKQDFKFRIDRFEELKTTAGSITDPVYVGEKNKLGAVVSEIIGLSARDVRSRVLAIELSSGGMEVFTGENKEMIPGIMSNTLFITSLSLLISNFWVSPFITSIQPYSCLYFLLACAGCIACVSTGEIKYWASRINRKLNYDQYEKIYSSPCFILYPCVCFCRIRRSSA